jgi:hypothetical protein
LDHTAGEKFKGPRTRKQISKSRKNENENNLQEEPGSVTLDSNTTQQ